MLTVIWGIDGFHVVNLMNGQHSYNTEHLLSHILEPMLLTVFPDGRKPHFCPLTLRLDNCCIHRSKASENVFAEDSIIRLLHPPYSPDLAPSNLWLFGHMKAALAGQQVPKPEGFLTDIQGFLSEIQRSELGLIFHHWMERVQWILNNDRDYCHE
jgi:hypothetical protein